MPTKPRQLSRDEKLAAELGEPYHVVYTNKIDDIYAFLREIEIEEPIDLIDRNRDNFDHFCYSREEAEKEAEKEVDQELDFDEDEASPEERDERHARVEERVQKMSDDAWEGVETDIVNKWRAAVEETLDYIKEHTLVEIAPNWNNGSATVSSSDWRGAAKLMRDVRRSPEITMKHAMSDASVSSPQQFVLKNIEYISDVCWEMDGRPKYVFEHALDRQFR